MKNTGNRMGGGVSFGSVILLALVVGGVYYASKHDVASKFNAYVENFKTSYQGDSIPSVGNFDLSSLTSIFDSITGPIFSGTGTSSGTSKLHEPIEADTVILPGPLEKIKETPTYGNNTDTVQPVAGPLSIAGIIASTNSERTSRMTSALSENSQLNVSAKMKADDILARQYFEHTAPDGKTVSDLINDAGYIYVRVGENLALGNFKDDADVVKAWMNSPGHRANILDSRYTEIGVGVALGMYDGHTVVVAVQHFGRPRSACPEISTTLKAQVEGGKAELAVIAKGLEELKKAIEQGRAEGKNMNDQVEVYNASIAKYQIRLKEVEALRVQYNAQVDAFNKCATR